MISKNRYFWWTGFVLTITLYVLFGEVVNRFDELYDSYIELSKKQSTILSPEEYAVRKIDLEQEHQRLLKWVHDKNLKGEQGQGNLFEYMNSNASYNHVLIQSVIPQAPIEEGKARIIPFTINASAKYHDIAVFINRLEMGTIPIMIHDISVRAERMGDQRLTIALKGQARLFKEGK